MEKIKITIPENFKKTTISNQGFQKDGYKLLDVFVDDQQHYYCVVECENCGAQKIVAYYGFINLSRKAKKCDACKYSQEIGKIYGCFEILNFEYTQQVTSKTGKSSRQEVYYKVKCIKCGKEYIKAFRKNDWLKYNNCTRCSAAFDNTFENRLLAVYKNGAKVRNIKWELSNDNFINLIHSNCHYCGSKPKYQNLYTPYNTPIEGNANGIDRIDSDKNYTIDNVVPCCTKCNLMKSTYTKIEFLDHINLIYDYQRKQGSETIENTLENNGSE